MAIESWIYNEEEKKKKKLEQKDNNEASKKIIEHKKVKEKISIEIESENEINNLKELVSKWVISKEQANNVIKWIELDDSTISEMFDKINQIEETKDIDNYLPKELRISKDEYKQALVDDIFRIQTITKLNSALLLLSNKINPDNILPINLFTWFLNILDKKLILIQENTIDLKNNLVDIENKKNPKIDNRSFWQKIMDFFRDIFKK